MARRTARAEIQPETDAEEIDQEEQAEEETDEENEGISDDEVEQIRSDKRRSAARPKPEGDGLHLILSADQVADQLGAERAEVVELMRRGIIPAKKMGGDLYTTVEHVVAYFRKPDRPDTLARYRTGDRVVVLESEESAVVGFFKEDQPDGRVLVSIPCWYGTEDESFPPEQVQPLIARMPRASKH